jgi:hypothetical protein
VRPADVVGVEFEIDVRHVAAEQVLVADVADVVNGRGAINGLQQPRQSAWSHARRAHVLKHAPDALPRRRGGREDDLLDLQLFDKLRQIGAATKHVIAADDHARKREIVIDETEDAVWGIVRGLGVMHEGRAGVSGAIYEDRYLVFAVPIGFTVEVPPDLTPAKPRGADQEDRDEPRHHQNALRKGLRLGVDNPRSADDHRGRYCEEDRDRSLGAGVLPDAVVEGRTRIRRSAATE